MKTITLNICVDDDFEPGCCYDCPLSYDDVEDDWNAVCVLFSDGMHCPLKPNLLSGKHADMLIVDDPLIERS